jgi:signal transduction histidine kinase
VRAINAAGTASANEARAVVVVEPTATQNPAFRFAVALGALAATVALYRYRLRRAIRRIADRHDARLAERERIARTLHDTFLQSVQAVMLQVHAAARQLPSGDAVRARLEATLDQADDALAEGRKQVHELRSDRDVERVLREAGELLAGAFPRTRFVLSVGGRRAPLLAHVKEDIVEIGAEALRNAFCHARATRITLSLAYGADALALRVTDNGCGIDEAQVRKRVKDKHWGLVGMRDRAVRIGGQLSIEGRRGKGTGVELRLPARLAYAARQEARTAEGPAG